MFRRELQKAAWVLLIPLTVWAVWVGESGLIVLLVALGVAPLALRARWRWRLTALLLVPPLLVLHVELDPDRNEWDPSPEFKADNMTYLIDLNGLVLVARYWTGHA